MIVYKKNVYSFKKITTLKPTTNYQNKVHASCSTPAPKSSTTLHHPAIIPAQLLELSVNKKEVLGAGYKQGKLNS